MAASGIMTCRHCSYMVGHAAKCPMAIFVSIAEEANFDANELCIYCGLLVENPCDEPPPDTCEKALGMSIFQPAKRCPWDDFKPSRDLG